MPVTSMFTEFSSFGLLKAPIEPNKEEKEPIAVEIPSPPPTIIIADKPKDEFAFTAETKQDLMYQIFNNILSKMETLEKMYENAGDEMRKLRLSLEFFTSPKSVDEDEDEPPSIEPPEIQPEQDASDISVETETLDQLPDDLFNEVNSEIVVDDSDIEEVADA